MTTDVIVQALGARPAAPVTGADIADRLCAAIAVGALPTGTPLTQRQLAEFFGVSRMPVREALRQVQARGLIGGTRYCSPVVMAPQEPHAQLATALARVNELTRQLDEARHMLVECVEGGNLPHELELRALRVSVGHRLPAEIQTGAGGDQVTA